MCARSKGQLVCVNRRPRRTEAPTVTAANTSAKKSRRPLGTEVIDRSSALRSSTLTSVSPELPKLRRELVEARESFLPERSLLYRRLHRAARLRIVPAVREAALVGQRSDVVERLFNAILGVPEPDFAHARVVDQQSTGRERDELAARGRVPSCAVA